MSLAAPHSNRNGASHGPGWTSPVEGQVIEWDTYLSVEAREKLLAENALVLPEVQVVEAVIEIPTILDVHMDHVVDEEPDEIDLPELGELDEVELAPEEPTGRHSA